MYAVTGITGRVGGRVAEALLAAGEPVRAVVRHPDRGAAWTARGCEVAVVADMADHAALARALQDTTGAFLMNPPNYDPAPGFADTVRTADAYARAVDNARPGRVVALSSVGAQVTRFNLLNNAGMLEAALSNVVVPVAFLRPAWFIENAEFDVADARAGRIESFLQPADRAIDMVSAQDVGRVAAELLREIWHGRRVVELSGPRALSPADVASAFSRALGHPIDVAEVPRSTWDARFRSDGMRHPEARMAMLDGFNTGWLRFAGKEAGTEQRLGCVGLDAAIAAIMARR